MSTFGYYIPKIIVQAEIDKCPYCRSAQQALDRSIAVGDRERVIRRALNLYNLTDDIKWKLFSNFANNALLAMQSLLCGALIIGAIATTKGNLQAVQLSAWCSVFAAISNMIIRDRITDISNTLSRTYNARINKYINRIITSNDL